MRIFICKFRVFFRSQMACWIFSILFKLVFVLVYGFLHHIRPEWQSYANFDTICHDFQTSSIRFVMNIFTQTADVR